MESIGFVDVFFALILKFIRNRTQTVQITFRTIAMSIEIQAKHGANSHTFSVDSSWNYAQLIELISAHFGLASCKLYAMIAIVVNCSINNLWTAAILQMITKLSLHLLIMIDLYISHSFWTESVSQKVRNRRHRMLCCRHSDSSRPPKPW